MSGVVARLGEEYGFIRTVDGRDVYFHKNSVLDFDWDALDEGAGVAFEEEDGNEGPQASTVRVVDARRGSKAENGA